MSGPTPNPRVPRIKPKRPQQPCGPRRALYPEEPSEEEHAYDSTQRWDKLILDRCLMHHLAVMLENQWIEHKSGRTGEEPRRRNPSQQAPFLLVESPDC